MRIGRTLPPAAAPLSWKDLLSGIRGWRYGKYEINRFKNELKEYFQAEFCYLLSSGKAALSITLEALNKIYPERDEVLIPAFTCYSVPSAISRAGLKVRLCDVDPVTLDFNYDHLRDKLENDRLLCVISTHLFGKPADIKRLEKMIVDPEISIIEDAAQAFGARYKGKNLGTTGDVGIFSLGRGKAFSTVEGGVIITNRKDVAEQVEKIFSRQPEYNFIECLTLIFYALALKCLLHPNLYWVPKLLPFLRLGETIYDPHFKIRRISSVQAGFTRDWQRRIESMRNERNNKSRIWIKFFETHGLQNQCIDQDGLSDLIRFPLRLTIPEVRKSLLAESEVNGLGVSSTYPDSVASIRELREKFVNKSFPVAEQCAKQLLTLPIHSMIQDKDIKKIQQLILSEHFSTRSEKHA